LITNQEDELDAYIVFAFTNATLVLSVGESIEEVLDSGFISSTTTLGAHQLGDDSLVQIYPHGIRHIRSNKRVVEWKPPAGKTIVKSAQNQRQVIIAMSSAEIVYFELDAGGNLNEYQERKEMSAQITCLSLGPKQEGRVRCRYLVSL
jgi:splicing factor 3B subunit 3